MLEQDVWPPRKQGQEGYYRTVYAPDTPETDGWERERHEIETGERERAGKKFKSSQSVRDRKTDREKSVSSSSSSLSTRSSTTKTL